MSKVELFARDEEIEKLHRRFNKLSELYNDYLKTKELEKSASDRMGNHLSGKIIGKQVLSLSVYALLGYGMSFCQSSGLINGLATTILMIASTGGLILTEASILKDFYESYEKVSDIDGEYEAEHNRIYDELCKTRHEYIKAVEEQKALIDSLSHVEYQEYIAFLEEYEELLNSCEDDEWICDSDKNTKKDQDKARSLTTRV